MKKILRIRYKLETFLDYLSVWVGFCVGENAGIIEQNAVIGNCNNAVVILMPVCAAAAHIGIEIRRFQTPVRAHHGSAAVLKLTGRPGWFYPL